MISVITATYNAQNNIHKLISSLLNQADKDFEWIVVDGNSTDDTVKILESVVGINIRFISEPDIGIYDALNKGIMLSASDYYIVCGADDSLNSYSIGTFNNLILDLSEFDIFAFSFLMNGRIHKPNKYLGFLYGMRGNSSCHSVGLLIKKSLHNDFGYYFLNYPILDDQYFIQTCILSNSKIKRFKNVISGEYSTDGISSISNPKLLYSFFQMQVKFYKFKSVQYLFYCVRVLKYYLTSFIF